MIGLLEGGYLDDFQLFDSQDDFIDDGSITWLQASVNEMSSEYCSLYMEHSLPGQSRLASNRLM